MERKKTLINRIFSTKLLIIEWSFIVLFCIFIGFSVRAQAATSSTVLPYLPNNNFNSITQEELDNVLNKILETYPEADFSKIIVFKYGEGAWWTWADYETIPYYQVYCFPDDYVSNSEWYGPDLTNSNFSNFELFNSQYHISVNLNGVVGYTYCHRQIGDFIDKQNFGDGNFKAFFGDNTLTHIESPITFDFNINYPVYTSFTLNTQDPRLDSGAIVAPSGGNTSINGEATPPDLEGDNIGNDKPDIDNYVPTQPTAPTFDNSSLESMVESLYNWLVWEYNAITSTIKGLIKYLGDTITYSLQKVIDNIKNAIKNFYDNMKSLFEPLLNGLAEIGQSIKETIENIGLLLEAFFAPFDEEQFQEAYNNCQFISAVDGFKDSIEEFEHAFTNAEERDYYTLYLGFIMDGYTVNYDLDFSWLYPLRQYYRPIIWCVVVYEFFVYLCAQLSDYLQGRSGK